MPHDVLRFRTLQSCVDVTFWSELGNRKLDQYKLSETPIDIQGFLTASKYEELGSSMQVLGSSFDPIAAHMPQQGFHTVPGQLLLLNTTEAFKRLDKAAALKQVGGQIWADITSGAAEAHPMLLSRFLLLAHGDLKHFVFNYWFAFPALKPPQPFSSLSAQALSAAYPPADLQAHICTAADAWRGAAAAQAPGDSSSSASAASAAAAAMFCLMAVDTAAGTVQTASLSGWHKLHSQQQQTEVVLVMFDPCCEPLVPGWPLRNALLLAAVRWGVRQLKVLCVRDSSAGRAKAERCFVLEVALPEIPPGWNQAGPAAAAGDTANPPAMPEVLGWEANNEGKLKARTVDLSPFMSPTQLAEQAVDLNLRLMRWRAAPQLDVGALASTRCLLLGAGTLGCAVARALLAWGVRNITFVDSARVSFSNPVRQSLFTYEDCLEGGKPKAAAAADALRAIFPSVQAAGVDLVIPMPGHPPANAKVEATMQQAAEQLQQLVSDHDIIFLLTDTRESRWLPTMLAAAAGKVAITAALGFDTFLVMRHGLPASAAGADQQQPSQPGSSSSSSSHKQQHQQLGCYFCNDVVAPLNSTIDRTLDQQCTVARPGLAPIAGSLAVELMAALLQHPAAGHAPAGVAGLPAGAGGAASGSATAAGAGAGALGPVPHMIRGQLSGFSQTCMVGQAFSQCTACSAAVLQQYKADGWGFVLKVLQQPGELEELTGLGELHRQAAAMDLHSASSGEEDEDGGDAAGGGGSRAGAGGGGEDDWTEL